MYFSIPNKIKVLLELGRYNYPTGAFLLMWPCFWGVLYQPNFDQDLLKFLGLFIVGSFVMRGAGCTINDFFDKELDKKVSRTKNRPLARGALNNTDVLFFILFQLFIGLIVVVQFSLKVIFFSFLIIPLIFIYPILKRVTYFPQIFLGLIFNWGVIVGFLSQNNELNVGVVYLYLSGFFLTIAYDTIYAFQDLEDDKKAGIKSTAVLFEKNSTFFILSSLFLSYFFLNLSLIETSDLDTLKVVLLTSIVLICHLKQFINFNYKRSYKSIFDYNVWVGAIIALIVFLKNYL